MSIITGLIQSFNVQLLLLLTKGIGQRQKFCFCQAVSTGEGTCEPYLLSLFIEIISSETEFCLGVSVGCMSDW